MTDPSDRISELKIDRSTPTPERRGLLWPSVALLCVLGCVVWWFAIRDAGGATAVEIEIARIPTGSAGYFRQSEPLACRLRRPYVSYDSG